jgi:hypothetical protein
MNCFCKTIGAMAAAAALAGCGTNTSDERLDNLEQRVSKLEREAKTQQTAKLAQEAEKRNVAAQRLKARARMEEDSKTYSKEELDAIESLYQIANKEWGSEKATESLKTLVGKYKKANRTGCAILYLGQISKIDDERIPYLEDAIRNYGDCFYGDGVQVGAYARYYLAYAYERKGEKEKSEQIFEEIKTKFPDAIDHSGKNLVKVIEQQGK